MGDHEQLQAIGAGAPFRAITEYIGRAELSEIRRQRVGWQREASVAFATHRTAEALAAYRDQGGADAPQALRFQTNDGAREFAVSDRVVFLENNRDLGVKNGMLGTVAAVAEGCLGVMLDGREGAQVNVSTGDYKAIDHGYATTIHKTQGATVDRAYVLASRTMDRQLTYVAMTRHRDDVRLYAAMDEFADKRGGRLVAHGAAPYEHNPEKSESYYVTLESANGKQHTLWSKDLGRVMTEEAPQVGDEIALQHLGSVPVTLPDGTQTHRNTWKLQTVDELVHAQLENRLSRSGLKASTLDYVNGVDIKSAIAFGERRGLASRPSVLRSVRNSIARQAKRLAGLVTRLRDVAPEVSRASEWLIAPLVEAKRDVAKLVRDRALASPKVAEAEHDLAASAAKVYRNPDAAMAMFRQLLAEPAEAADRMASQVLNDPESVAALRGGTGLMAGRAARQERAAAIAAIPSLRQRIRDYRGMFGAMEAQERGMESDRRERLGVGIPALSQEASSLLQQLDGTAREGNTAFAAALEQATKDAPEVMAQLDSFQAALSKRLGPLERFLAGHDDLAPGEVAKTDRKRLMAHIPKLRQLQRFKEGVAEQQRLEQSRNSDLRL